MSEMFWSHKLGTMNVEFKSTPFMVTDHEHIHLHWQFEADYYKERRSNGLSKQELQK